MWGSDDPTNMNGRGGAGFRRMWGIDARAVIPKIPLRLRAIASLRQIPLAPSRLVIPALSPVIPAKAGIHKGNSADDCASRQNQDLRDYRILRIFSARVRIQIGGIYGCANGAIWAKRNPANPANPINPDSDNGWRGSPTCGFPLSRE